MNTHFRGTILIFVSVISLLLSTGCAHKLVVPEPIPVPSMPQIPQKPIQVAIVLSGGGARGVAHAGVLEVFEEYQIPVDLIVGSSAGSLIGVLYADDPNAERLKKKLIALSKWDLLDVSVGSGVKMLWELNGPVRGNALRNYLKENLSVETFEELKIPLVAVATDVNNGEAVILQNGALGPAIHASSAVPLIFSPVKWQGRTLVDGCVVSPIPVDVARSFAPKIVIAIDIGTTPDSGPVNTGYQVAVRSMHIAYFQLAKLQAKDADILIHPEVDQYGMFEDKYNQEMYEAGKEAALRALPEIQQRLKALQAPPVKSKKPPKKASRKILAHRDRS